MFTLDMNKPYTCKRIRLYNWLSDQGVYPKDRMRDVDNPRFYVWIYDMNDNVAKLIKQYYNRKEYLER